MAVFVVIFAAAAVLVWWAGIKLSNTTEVLDQHFGWGDALGGLVLLAVVTNLPDVAVVASAALQGDVGIATGSLLGGITVQTVILAVMDIVGGGNGIPLTSRTRTLIPALEALMVIMGLTLVVLGSQVDPIMHFRIEPPALVIVLIWFAGLLVVRRANKGLAWKLDEPESELPPEHSQNGDDSGIGRSIGLFGLAAAITLIGGVALERSGDRIASDLGIGSVVFGATAMAAATAIPDISTGIEAVRQGDHQLAISDVFGSNAFLPTQFFVAALVSGTAVLASAGRLEHYLAAFGIILTCIYLVGLVFRNRLTVLRMGFDSLLVIVVYAIGVAGLVFLV